MKQKLGFILWLFYIYIFHYFQITVRSSIELQVAIWRDRDSFAQIPTPGCFPVQHRSAWLKAFITYNTIVPSSASVERMFNMGSDILRQKRSLLNSESVEKLVFLRGNAMYLEDLLT